MVGAFSCVSRKPSGSLACKQHDGHGHDALATPDRAHTFVRGSLDRDQVRINTENAGDVLGDQSLHAGQTRGLCDDGHIAVADPQALTAGELQGVADKRRTLGAGPLGVRVGEVIADIACGDGAENCIRDGVQHYVGIAVTREPQIVIDTDSVRAIDEVVARAERELLG